MVSSVWQDENRDDREQDCKWQTLVDPKPEDYRPPETNLRIQMAREWVNLGGD